MSPSLEMLQARKTQLINKQLLDRIISATTAGAGVGLLGRGAVGAYNVGRRALGAPTVPGGPHVIDVPGDEEEEKVAGILDGMVDHAKGLFTNQFADTAAGSPYMLPGAAIGAGAGALGGWKLMDYILDKQRKKELDGELQAARDDYEGALQSAHSKQASALGKDLDRLFELSQEKQASPLGEAEGMSAGLLSLPMLMMGGASGLLTYNLTDQKRQQRVLRKALARQRRKKRHRNPTQIYAVPQMPGSQMQTGPDPEAMAGDPLDKEAAAQ